MNQLVKELKAYKYTSHKDSVDDHAADALRYFMVNSQYLPIKKKLSLWPYVFGGLIVGLLIAGIYLVIISLWN